MSNDLQMEDTDDWCIGPNDEELCQKISGSLREKLKI